MGVRDNPAVLVAIGIPESSGLATRLWRSRRLRLRGDFRRDLLVGGVRIETLSLDELQRRCLELAILAKDRLCVRGEG